MLWMCDYQGEKIFGVKDEPSITHTQIKHATTYRLTSGGYSLGHRECSNWIAALPNGLL